MAKNYVNGITVVVQLEYDICAFHLAISVMNPFDCWLDEEGEEGEEEGEEGEEESEAVDTEGEEKEGEEGNIITST